MRESGPGKSQWRLAEQHKCLGYFPRLTKRHALSTPERLLKQVCCYDGNPSAMGETRGKLVRHEWGQPRSKARIGQRVNCSFRRVLSGRPMAIYMK